MAAAADAAAEQMADIVNKLISDAATAEQERDAARAEKARLAAEAKRDFGNHPMPFLKPVKELDAATAHDA